MNDLIGAGAGVVLIDECLAVKLKNNTGRKHVG